MPEYKTYLSVEEIQKILDTLQTKFCQAGLDDLGYFLTKSSCNQVGWNVQGQVKSSDYIKCGELIKKWYEQLEENL